MGAEEVSLEGSSTEAAGRRIIGVNGGKETCHKATAAGSTR